MSLLGGILSKEREVEIPPRLKRSLQNAMASASGCALESYQEKGVFLLKLDVGTYGDRAFCIGSTGSVAIMTGDPVLRINGHSVSPGRTAALERLLEAMECDESETLCKTTGQFSLAYYRPNTRTLKLVCDKLGLRQVYYWDGPSFFIFASALHILEAIPEIPRVVDLRAVTEILNFGYALSSRTPYADVQALLPAEILTIGNQSAARKHYWRLDEVKLSKASEEEALDEIYHRFVSAVKLRIRNERTAVALLSGGLDSRCLVTALHAEAINIHTLNCSFPGTQEKKFAAEFASKIGSMHHELDNDVGDPNIFQILSNMLMSTHLEPFPERRLLLWGGNDGSLSLGHVFMTEEPIGLLRQGKLDQAIDAHLSDRSLRVVSRLFRSELAGQVSEVLRDGLRRELGDLRCEDPARNLWAFLTITNMRKHFRNTLEDIKHHKLEFQLPFLDPDFLSAIISVPIGWCLRHRLYVKWLERFGPLVTSVPWQTYPGHQPCSIASPDGLVDQWKRAAVLRKTESEARRFDLISQSRELLRSEGSGSIFDRRYLKFAQIAYMARLHDYGYLLKAALDYWKYLVRANGAIRLPL